MAQSNYTYDTEEQHEFLIIGMNKLLKLYKLTTKRDEALEIRVVVPGNDRAIKVEPAKKDYLTGLESKTEKKRTSTTNRLCTNKNDNRQHKIHNLPLQL